jgi:hypothetical protein
MAFELRDGLHWCDCGGRAVFLDTKADRYFCLSQTANEAFLRLAADKARPGDAERLQPLVARGMLVDGPAGGRIRRAPVLERPTCDILQSQIARAPLRPLMKALACEAAAAWALRSRRFDAVIDAIRTSGRPEMEEQPTQRTLQRIAAASAAVSLLTRSHDRCLVRALAAHRLCIKSGINANLVFGVIGHPFSAHCWVQVGSAVLVGGHEQARLYTPILVIG